MLSARTMADVASGFEGRVLGGKYRLGRVLGRGGMGIVLEAEQVALGRRVAVKLVRPGHTPSAVELERFQLEAKSAARVAGDGVVQILDVDYDAELGPYHVLELLVGESLRERLRRGAMAPREAVDTMLQLLETLERVHLAGIVHRDIKPGNVFLAAGGRVKVLDFGVVAVRDPTLVPHKLTVPGAMPGTPGYMAPEQMRAEPIDRRADVFGVAQVLYACLAGKPPFHGAAQTQVIAKTLAGETVNLRADRPGLPEALYAAIERAGASDRNRRTPTAAAFAEELRAAAAELGAGGIAVPITPPSGITVAELRRPMSIPTLESSDSHKKTEWTGTPSWAEPQVQENRVAQWVSPVSSMPGIPHTNPVSSPPPPQAHVPKLIHSASAPPQQPHVPQHIHAVSAPPPQPYIPPTAGTRFEHQERKSRAWLWIAIPVGLLALAGAAVAIFWAVATEPWEDADSSGAADATLASAQADVDSAERFIVSGRPDDALPLFDRAVAAIGTAGPGTPRHSLLARAHIGRGDVFVARMEAIGRNSATLQACATDTGTNLTQASNAYATVAEGGFGDYAQCAAERRGRMFETLYTVCGRTDPNGARQYLDQAIRYYESSNRPGPCRAAASTSLARVRALRVP